MGWGTGDCCSQALPGFLYLAKSCKKIGLILWKVGTSKSQHRENSRQVTLWKCRISKYWEALDILAPPLCDRRQISHFHEKQLLTGTGCLNKLVYSGQILFLSRHPVVQKKGENTSVQPPKKHKFKEMSVAALEKRFAGEPRVFCDIPVFSLCSRGWLRALFLERGLIFTASLGQGTRKGSRRLCSAAGKILLIHTPV